MSTVADLASAVTAEREARHQFNADLNNRVWTVNSDLKENYQTRREGLRLFGSITQKLDGNHREVMDKISGLPCTAPACPGEKKNA